MSNIAEIQKNANEIIRIEAQHFQGYQLVQLRVWYEAQDGALRPTKKGIAFQAALLPDVIGALISLEATDEAA